MKAAATSPRFHVGELVKARFGGEWVGSRITEDRGPMGGMGRHLYQVSIPNDPFEPMITERLEEDLQPYDPAREPPRQISRREIIDYLKQGGLIAILLQNQGGNHPPSAWLRAKEGGGGIHTFDPERGQVGGQAIPARATYFTKVFTPKRAEVAEYLRTFGLTPEEAEEVLKAVGTAPT
jgi:hypothetical protein